MSDSPRTPGRSSFGNLALYALGGLFLYILSPGLFTWLEVRCGVQISEYRWLSTSLEIAFMPLTYLYEHVHIVHSFYMTYYTLIGVLE